MDHRPHGGRAAARWTRGAILKQLLEADIFEQMLQTLYIGTKRFSLEGNTALIPLMEEIFAGAAGHGAEECVMAMSHRGRLAAVRNTVGRSATDIYAGFEDVDPRSTLGGGDVKYHQGATGIPRLQRPEACGFTWSAIPAIWRPSIPWRWGGCAPSRPAAA